MTTSGHVGSFEKALESAGIRIVPIAGNARPHDLITSEKETVEREVRARGLVGLGDLFVRGVWRSRSVDQFFDRALRADLPQRLATHPRVILNHFRQKVFNFQNRPHARSNVERHYNLGNDVFEATLDSYMQYTCGYWKKAETLELAQRRKLELVCRKLGLEPGMMVLDLGCGWGGFARYAAEEFGAQVVGVTLSVEQKKFAENLCRGKLAEFRLQDFRDVRGQFDRVVSIGMFEHVGPKNLRAAVQVIHRCLKDDGLALLQFFASRDSFPNRNHSEVMWINENIFPGLVVPSLKQIGAAIDGYFVLEDLHNFGAHYDKTLLAWALNFHNHWPNLQPKYDAAFYRTWMYYLLSCAGAFRAREYQLWQLVLSKNGVPGGYVRPDVPY